MSNIGERDAITDVEEQKGDGLDYILTHFESVDLNDPEIARRLADPQVAMEVIRASQLQLRIKAGLAFATLEEVYSSTWVSWKETDFDAITRNWENHVFDHDNCHFKDIYNATRDEALDDANIASESQKTMAVTGLSPVRLCAGTQESSEDAHLCPKHGPDRKIDTWLYVAAAVLGMKSDDKADRQRLYKALRGSSRPDKKGTVDKTGLARCPFNLVSLMEQKTWFGLFSCVMVLPVRSVDEARDWSGGPYSVIVLCHQDIRVKDSAAAIAKRIGLPDTNVTNASPADIQTAQDLLTQVLKASAFCLHSKNGPDNPKSQQLFASYKERLAGAQSLMRSMGGESVEGKIPVPTRLGSLTGKIVAKIDLAVMGPTVEGDTPAYPDPMMVVHKSSINWTRKHAFQMIAEACPAEDRQYEQDRDYVQLPAMGFDNMSGLSADHGSNKSAHSQSGSRHS